MSAARSIALAIGLALVAPMAPATAQTAPTATQPPRVPDISGPWRIADRQAMLKDAAGAPPPLLPAARRRYAQHVAARAAGKLDFDNLNRCTPPGVPRIMTIDMPFRIVQGQRHYVMLFQWNHMPRILYLNQPHFESIGSEYLGQSVARWENETLVVDTNSFNDVTLLDDAGIPHSDALHAVERIRLVGDKLENRITITDPKTFSRPWTAVLRFNRQPGAVIGEDYCLGRMGLGVSRSK